MSKTWLVVDANSCCYRSFFSVGGLTYGDDRTGTIYGFLRTMVDLSEEFRPCLHVFCFDSPNSRRRDLYPKYKSSRRQMRQLMTAERRESFVGFKKQVRLLRKVILPQLGFRNVFCCDGYEADDLIASVCQRRPRGVEMVLVSSDHDLYQLLGTGVVMWGLNKSRLFSAEWFRNEYGLEPTQWADVKAIAGCSTDDVRGIKGVGEKVACRYLRGSLSAGVRFRAIVEGDHIWKRNLCLVRLPFEGTPQLRVRRDASDEKRKRAWREICQRYGFQSLLRRGV